MRGQLDEIKGDWNMPETKVEYNRRKRKDNAAKRQRNREAFESLGITQARFNELVKEAKDNGAIAIGFKIVREGEE